MCLNTNVLNYNPCLNTNVLNYKIYIFKLLKIAKASHKLHSPSILLLYSMSITNIIMRCALFPWGYQKGKMCHSPIQAYLTIKFSLFGILTLVQYKNKNINNHLLWFFYLKWSFILNIEVQESTKSYWVQYIIIIPTKNTISRNKNVNEWSKNTCWKNKCRNYVLKIL